MQIAPTLEMNGEKIIGWIVRRGYPSELYHAPNLEEVRTKIQVGCRSLDDVVTLIL